jgi:hypothetical protein
VPGDELIVVVVKIEVEDILGIGVQARPAGA